MVTWWRSLPAVWQDVLIAVSSAGIGVIAYPLNWLALFLTGLTVPEWVRIALFGGICVVQVFRRKAPIGALVAGFVIVVADGLIGPSLAVLLVFSDLVYSAVLYGPRRSGRILVTILALTAVALLGIGAASGTAPILVMLTGVALVPLLGISAWWATSVRQHMEIAEAERVNAEQLARIAELDRRAAVAAERARLARDLHDVIAGHLSAIAIQSEAALNLTDASPETQRAVLASVRENSVRALEEMRAMIELLRADSPGADEDDTGEAVVPAGLSELGTLVESARASGLDIEVRSELGDSTALPTAVDLTAYRIAQEALTNVMKHAPGARARMDLRVADGALTVEVVNELPAGADRGPGTGAGLSNMRERAMAVGGSLVAGPSGQGWLVRAVLPLAGVRA
ncbi:two-component sensor histidine kinase [Thermopolyspora flexuosa]|nr:two-component sensor histidine kinase [Thermopolyspora flexuosa]